MGVQEFDWIRQKNAIYVDKTAYVWRMANEEAHNFFLSRPRRFGKSLFVDTLRCYFEGRKELFEGLEISKYEKEWRKHPVIRLDLSSGKYYEKEQVHPTISSILRDYEKLWNVTIYDEYSYADRLKGIIQAAYEQTGEQVVVLIDEYDAPMLDSVNNPELQDFIRERIRSLFSPLKAQSQYLRFVFLTGISKFSQLSVFSELNNLKQITFDPAYEGICGITEEELLTQMQPDIMQLAENMNKIYSRWGLQYSYEDVVAKLKHTYDGYHFSESFTDIYCPWSLINAFSLGDIRDFWFSTGTPSMLINVMRAHRIYSMPQLEGLKVKMSRFDAPTERIKDPVPVLFQSGYLTLKDYNPFTQEWTLGFPNDEVNRGFAHSLYLFYMEDYVGSEDMVGNAFNRLRSGETNIEQFIESLRRWYSGIPYSITDKNQNEQLYQSLLYAALVAVGADVQAEAQTADGRMDIALRMPSAIYVMELKYGRTAEEATKQILEKGYAELFASDARSVYAIGLNISADRRTIDSYQIIPL